MWILVLLTLSNGILIESENFELSSKIECLNFIKGTQAAAKLGNIMNPKRDKITVSGTCTEIKK